MDRSDYDEAMESLCRRCGLCCHHKVKFGDVVVITDVACEFLDPATNLCTVYPNRFAKQPLCASAKYAIKAQSHPGNCPYVAGLDNYVAPLLLSEHPEYEQAVNALYPDRGKKKGGGMLLKSVKYGRGKRD